MMFLSGLRQGLLPGLMYLIVLDRNFGFEYYYEILQNSWVEKMDSRFGENVTVQHSNFSVHSFWYLCTWFELSIIPWPEKQDVHIQGNVLGQIIGSGHAFKAKKDALIMYWACKMKFESPLSQLKYSNFKTFIFCSGLGLYQYSNEKFDWPSTESILSKWISKWQISKAEIKAITYTKFYTLYNSLCITHNRCDLWFRRTIMS